MAAFLNNPVNMVFTAKIMTANFMTAKIMTPIIPVKGSGSQEGGPGPLVRQGAPAKKIRGV